MKQLQEEPMRRYDIYARFAGRYLRTPAEQAVYLTLVSQAAPSWSAAEMAQVNGLDVGETERILADYESSGIVQKTGTQGGRRYRWRSDMNYLFSDVSDSPEWVDPVCGMPVTTESPYWATDLLRRPRRFCSSLCLAAFRALPGTVTRPPRGMGDGG